MYVLYLAINNILGGYMNIQYVYKIQLKVIIQLLWMCLFMCELYNKQPPKMH